MKKKELQRFSKEVFAAAVVSLSVAGTAIPAQAASTQDAAVGVVETQEQSDETEAQTGEAADAAVTDTEEGTTADSEASEQGQNEEETTADAESQAGEENGQNTASEEAAEQAGTENADSQPEQSEENAEDQTEDTASDSKEVDDSTQEKVSCWETDEYGNTYYYDANGEKVHGITEIDRKTYVFDYEAINEQISNFAQTYPTNLKASSNEALLFMRRYRFANCSCFSCCFKDAYPSSNVQ